MRPTDAFNQFTDAQRQALAADRNLAVRANAGSGKTSVLVERVVQLLARSYDEGKPLDVVSVVAITFTRKAATELQERLRTAFETMAQAASGKERVYWLHQADELPRAMIGTIDGFCARILREYGVRAGSPGGIEPDYEPLEEYDETILKREAIDRVINRLSGPLPPGATDEERAQADACRWWATKQGYYALTRHLTALLDHLIDPETIVAAHVGLPPAETRVEEAWSILPAVKRLDHDRERLNEDLQALLDRIAGLGRKGSNQTLAELQAAIPQVLDLLARPGREADAQVLSWLQETFLTQKGEPRSQGFSKVSDEVTSLQRVWVPLLVGFVFDFEGEVEALYAADLLVRLLGPVHAEYEHLCREANRYDFLAIARRTRDLLQAPEVRGEVKKRYPYVMVDEFQDTNQLQWEILSAVTGDGPDGLLDRDRLYIVGDPQQSIFRFRQADVSVFGRVIEKIHESNAHHGSEGPGLVKLDANFRSLSPMPLGLMDHVFQHVFDPQAHGLDPERNGFEVRYQRLVAGRKPSDPAAQGEVRYVIPLDEDDGAGEPAADEETESAGSQPLEHAQVHLIVDQLVALVGRPYYPTDHGPPRPLTYGDMAVLLPSRDVVLTALEKELRERNVPFVVTGGIGFWQRQEVRDLISLAGYLGDPGDELALFAVLRSPLGQLGDTDILFLSQLGRGSLNRGLRMARLAGDDLSDAPHADEKDRTWLREQWPKLPTQVRAALVEMWNGYTAEARDRLRQTAARLDAWRQRVDRMTHADLLQRALEESGAYALYAAEAEGKLMLANLDLLFAAIRADEERSASGLARLARRLRGQTDEMLKTQQATLADADGAVQILTVHAAKGLEFPVVAVLKMERKADHGKHPSLMVKSAWDALLPDGAADFPAVQPGTVAVSVRHPRFPRETYTPRLLAALRRLDRAQQVAESRRLFYVAATRARQYLILAGKEPKRKMPESWQKWFEQALGLTAEHKQGGVWEDAGRGFRVPIITRKAEAPPPPESPAEVPRERLDLRTIGERPLVPLVATTELERLRAEWHRDPLRYWLGRHRQVLPDVNRAATIVLPQTGAGEPAVGAIIGQVVHRLFELPDALALPAEELNALIGALATGLLAPAEDEPARDRVADGERVFHGVRQILQRLRSADTEGVRRLLQAPGETEVPFALRVGRWQITGRFDKLLPTDGGFEVVDWKTDGDADPAAIVDRHSTQMRLYALALNRSGRAPGVVRVHLVLLHHGCARVLTFAPAELETFAEELRRELEEMDAYEPG